MSNRKLELIHVIFRHGERTPDDITFYKKENATNCNEYYPYGVGQLTNKGKQQMYELGKTLRHRYDEFLGEIFLPKHVDAWSSEFDRAKASSMLVLAGLYPPKKELIWNDSLLWQPIPIKYNPVQNDKIFIAGGTKEYREAYNENFKKSPYAKKLLNDYKDVLSYVERHTGMKIYNTFEACKIYDCTIREKMFNIHPEWATDSIISQLREVALQELTVMMTETIELKRLLCGPMLEKIVYDSLEKIQETSTRKIHLYGGHDINIMTILNALDMLKPHLPEEGSCVVVELYSVNKEYEIEVKYRRNLYGTFDIQLYADGKSVWPFRKLEEQLQRYGPKTPRIARETKIADRVFAK